MTHQTHDQQDAQTDPYLCECGARFEAANVGMLLHITDTGHKVTAITLRTRLTQAEADLTALRAENEELKEDMTWRHRWHDRLGRGAATEGRFYESVEQQMQQLTALRASLQDVVQEMDKYEACSVQECAWLIANWRNWLAALSSRSAVRQSTETTEDARMDRQA